VLNLASHGVTDQEIADIVGMSYWTVRNDWYGIFRELGCKASAKRRQAVTIALREGHIT